MKKKVKALAEIALSTLLLDLPDGQLITFFKTRM